MSRPVSLRAEIQDLGEILKRYGYSMPELEHIDNPNTLDLLLHPFTRHLLKTLNPAFTQLLADIHVKERIHRLSSMDASEKLIDIGLAASGREAKKKHVNTEKSKS